MIAVGLNGGNDCFMPIGLFETQAQAEKALLEAGAEWKTFSINYGSRKGETFRAIVITPMFKGYMEGRGLDFYSVGGACDVDANFSFVKMPVGTISRGYNDD